MGLVFGAYDVAPFQFTYLDGLPRYAFGLGLGSADVWVVDARIVRA